MSSNQFETEAKDILNNAPSPDADANTIKEHSSEAGKKRRGRPPGSGGKKAKTVSSKSKSENTPDDFNKSAVAFNTIVFSATCAFTGTKDAWPEKEREELMDKALARYLQIKDIVAPPEAVLLQEYARYVAEISQKETVKNNVAKRFGGIKGKFVWINKLTQKFKKPQISLGKEKIK